MKLMTVAELNAKLAARGIVPLPTAEWEEVQAAYPELERHSTFIAGDLTIVRGEDGPVAVEEPSSTERVLRRLDADQVRDFVTDRLDTYERMWDGCGCRVEYYEP